MKIPQTRAQPDTGGEDGRASGVMGARVGDLSLQHKLGVCCRSVLSNPMSVVGLLGQVERLVGSMHW